MQKTKTRKCKFVGPSRSDGKEGNRPCPRKYDGHLILDGAAALLIESDLSIHLAWLITSIFAVDNRLLHISPIAINPSGILLDFL